MSRDWTPQREMRQVPTEAARAEALAEGMRICDEHGAWHPEVWGQCPVCFERNDPMALRRRLREEASSGS